MSFSGQRGVIEGQAKLWTVFEKHGSCSTSINFNREEQSLVNIMLTYYVQWPPLAKEILLFHQDDSSEHTCVFTVSKWMIGIAPPPYSSNWIPVAIFCFPTLKKSRREAIWWKKDFSNKRVFFGKLFIWKDSKNWIRLDRLVNKRKIKEANFCN